MKFRQVLKDSSRDMGEPGYDNTYGWGLIDVGAALAAQRAEQNAEQRK